jgi:hypothetical protein
MNEAIMKLDEWGKPAWIALMVSGFIVFWPVGLAVLAYMIWSGRMGCGWNGDKSRWQSRMTGKWSNTQKWGSEGGKRASGFGSSSSGNAAFDEYREDTLRRLEEEQRDFRDFLERLRHAKDRSEFDQFMTERRNRPATPPKAEPNPAA